MSSSGVPWAGIVMTSVVFVLRLGAQRPRPPTRSRSRWRRRSIGVLFTWGTIFALPAPASAAGQQGRDPAEPVPGAGLSRGPATSGWPSWSWCSSAWRSRAGSPRRTSGTRPTSWSSCSASRSSRILVHRLAGGEAQGRREHRRPAQGGLVATPGPPTARDVDARGRADRPAADEPRSPQLTEHRNARDLRRATDRPGGWPALAGRRVATLTGVRSAACSAPTRAVADARGVTGRQAHHRHRRSTSRASGSRTATPTPGSTSTPRSTSPRRWACRRRTSPGRRPTPSQPRAAADRGEADLVVSTSRSPTSASRRSTSPGPYFVAHQDLLVRRNDDRDHRPGRRWTARTCARSPAPPRRPTSRATTCGKIKLSEYPTFSDCVDGAGQQRGRRGHHRRRDPGRLRRRAAVQGQAQGGRQGLLRRALRRSG